MRIVIPTHGRVDKQITLAHLPDSIREDVLVVTSLKEEAAALKQRWSKLAVKVAPVNSIADKRQWILENVRDDVFMLDDDMAFYRRCAPREREFVNGRLKARRGFKTLSLEYVTDAALEELFGHLDEMLVSYPAVGISSRFGNDLEPMDYKPGANRLMHGFGYHRKTLLQQKFKFNAVAFREDFHMALTLLRAGYENYQVYEWCVAPGAYGAPGGCSDERTVAASDAAAFRLAELHPGYVAVVDKNYKGTPRKEVRVSWARALRDGQAK